MPILYTARGWHWLGEPRAQRAAIVLFEISYLRFEIRSAGRCPRG